MKHRFKITVGIVGGLFIAAGVAATILTGGMFVIAVLAAVSVATVAGLAISTMQDEKRDLEVNVKKLTDRDIRKLLNISDNEPISSELRRTAEPILGRMLRDIEFEKKYAGNGLAQVGNYFAKKITSIFNPTKESSENKNTVYSMSKPKKEFPTAFSQNSSENPLYVAKPSFDESEKSKTITHQYQNSKEDKDSTQEPSQPKKTRSLKSK